MVTHGSRMRGGRRRSQSFTRPAGAGSSPGGAALIYGYRRAVRSFTCGVCGQLVFFENSLCLSCRTPLGFSPSQRRIVPLTEDDAGDPVYAAGGAPEGRQGDSAGAYAASHPEPVERRCANRVLAACNWLAAPQAPGGLCLSCAMTRTRPADSDETGMAQFAVTEAAKRRLVYQLLDLGLPVVRWADDPEHGLAFDLLSSAKGPVTTGHADGIITIDLAEGDDPHREALRVQLDEPYRTMLGHLRHETGHYYWGLLVRATSALEPFRALFGDERVDYGEALRQHYAQGVPAGWEDGFVSAYAAMHPWEDWAETFAHYLHVRDTLQTAAEHGIVIEGPLAAAADGEDPTDEALAVVPRGDARDIDELVRMWLPLTYALNAVNRSMGKDDLYPFVLSPTVIEKLGFVHDVVSPGRDADDPADGVPPPRAAPRIRPAPEAPRIRPAPEAPQIRPAPEAPPAPPQ